MTASVVAKYQQNRCRTTSCEKGFLSIKCFAFTHVPPVVTAS